MGHLPAQVWEERMAKGFSKGFEVRNVRRLIALRWRVLCVRNNNDHHMIWHETLSLSLEE